MWPGRPEAAIHGNGWRGHDGLIDMGSPKHFRVTPRRAARHGIESIWSSYTMRRPAHFNGVPAHLFRVHLKTEGRFNHRNEDLHKALLKLLRDHPL